MFVSSHETERQCFVKIIMLSSFTRKEGVFISLINNEMIINFSAQHLILSNCWKAYLLFKWKCQIACSLSCFSLSHRENYTSSWLYSFHYFAWCKRKACLMQRKKIDSLELGGNMCLLYCRPSLQYSRLLEHLES